MRVAPALLAAEEGLGGGGGGGCMPTEEPSTGPILGRVGTTPSHCPSARARSRVSRVLCFSPRAPPLREEYEAGCFSRSRDTLIAFCEEPSPVSNPSESGLGGQEEPTQSEAQMKRDPNEPDSGKREEVLKHGEN